MRISFLSVLMVNTFAMGAASAVASEITPIRADYRCEQPGGGFAFRLPTANTPVRIWLTDVGEPDGLELRARETRLLRSANNFSFYGSLGAGGLEYHFEVHGNARGVQSVDAYARDAETDWQPILKNLRCVRVRTAR